MEKYLLIPGNPAVANQYHTWIKEIESRDNNMSVAYASSYVLFSRRLNPIEYDQAMRSHYEKLFLQLQTQEKITIIAHSVGGYFALRLLEKYPEKVKKAIIIFPYIGYSKFKSLRFVSIPYWIDRIFPLVELVSRFKNLFQKWDVHIQSISNYELTACLRFGVRQCTYFNKHKFDTQIVSHSKEKLHFIYTEKDKWCPTETIELLKPISNFKKVDLPHSFIIDRGYREKMLDEIMLIIKS